MNNIKKIKSELLQLFADGNGFVQLMLDGNKLIMSINLRNPDDVQELESILERNGGDDLAGLTDILDLGGFIGNGWNAINADALGAMSEAPCITENVYTNDEGEFEEDEDSKIYYYADYMLYNLVEVLLENGKVVFTKM